MSFDLKVTSLFQKLRSSKAKIILSRGSTRSSKSYSNSQNYLLKSFEHSNVKILITRATMPALRLSAYQDFKDVLLDTNNSHNFTHNKTNHVYTNKKTGSEIHFISCDNEQKVRGVKWNYVNLCECNEISYDIFRQILMRLAEGGQIVCDWNPSEDDIWMNNELEQSAREDVEVIVSTYLDNPFLGADQIKEIERLKDSDPIYWQVFGLGEYGQLRHKVYNNWEVCSDLDFDSAPTIDTFYGLDFGYVHPMAFYKMKYYDGTVWVKKVTHESYIEDQVVSVHESMSGRNNLDPIYADSANPDKINQISNLGHNIMKADKHVSDGIDFVRRLKVKICESSKEAIREFKNYKYIEVQGKPTSTPIKFNDDAMDAIRYGIFTHLKDYFDS